MTTAAILMGFVGCRYDALVKMVVQPGAVRIVGLELAPSKTASSQPASQPTDGIQAVNASTLDRLFGGVR